MVFQNVTLLDENFKIREKQYVQVKGDRIVYIGDAFPETPSGKWIDGKNKLMIPGLVNAHTHVPMTLLRGYGEGLPLDRWLNERIFPYEHELEDSDVYSATQLGIAEMVRFGTASFTDMYDHCGKIAHAVKITGIRANISRGVLCFDDSPLKKLEAFKESVQLYQTLYNDDNGGRIKVDMCIHGEYTSTPRVVREMAAYAKSLGCGMHIHLAETKEETDACISRHGMTPTRYMEEMGVFENPCTAAHCVWLTEEDMDILARNHVTVVHCPVSNLKLGSGVAPIPDLLKRGVNVALGTDGCASNNNLNLFEEIKLAAILHKGINRDPSLCTPEEILRCATVNGAKAQGRKDCGLIKEGYKADLVLLDISGPHWCPQHDLVGNIVYSAQGSDVVLTMVDGKILYQNGEFWSVNFGKIKPDCIKANERILQKLGN